MSVQPAQADLKTGLRLIDEELFPSSAGQLSKNGQHISDLTVIDAKNVMPTLEGYGSFFGVDTELASVDLDTNVQDIIGYRTLYGDSILLAFCDDGLYIRSLAGEGTIGITTTPDNDISALLIDAAGHKLKLCSCPHTRVLTLNTQETVTHTILTLPEGKGSWTEILYPVVAFLSPWKLWTYTLLKNHLYFYAKGFDRILKLTSYSQGQIVIEHLNPTYIIGDGQAYAFTVVGAEDGTGSWKKLEIEINGASTVFSYTGAVGSIYEGYRFPYNLSNSLSIAGISNTLTFSSQVLTPGAGELNMHAIGHEFTMTHNGDASDLAVVITEASDVTTLALSGFRTSKLTTLSISFKPCNVTTSYKSIGLWALNYNYLAIRSPLLDYNADMGGGAVSIFGMSPSGDTILGAGSYTSLHISWNGGASFYYYNTLFYTYLSQFQLCLDDVVYIRYGYNKLYKYTPMGPTTGTLVIDELRTIYGVGDGGTWSSTYIDGYYYITHNALGITSIYRTANGENYTYMGQGAITAPINNVFPYTDGIIALTLTQALILNTTTYAVSVVTINLPTTSTRIWAYADTIYQVTAADALYKSTDAGASFSLVSGVAVDYSNIYWIADTYIIFLDGRAWDITAGQIDPTNLIGDIEASYYCRRFLSYSIIPTTGIGVEDTAVTIDIPITYSDSFNEIFAKIVAAVSGPCLISSALTTPSAVAQDYSIALHLAFYNTTDYAIATATKGATTTFEVSNPITRLTELAHMEGITSGKGRLVAWDVDNLLYWSSATDLTDFTPSAETRANQMEVTSILGKIIKCEGYSNGFIIYSTGNVVRGVFEGGTYTYKFEPIKGINGITDPRHISATLADHYIWANMGLMQLNPVAGTINLVIPELTDWVSNYRYPLTLRMIAGRYLVIYLQDRDLAFSNRHYRNSEPNLEQAIPHVATTEIDFAPARVGLNLYPTYSRAIIFDTVLGKWGSADLDHKLLFSLDAINQIGYKVEKDYNLMSEELHNKQKGLAILDANGVISLANAYPTDSYIAVGKYAASRDAMTKLVEVITEFVSYPSATIQIEKSIDGSAIDTTQTVTSSTITDMRHSEGVNITGQWLNILIRGHYSLKRLLVKGYEYGRRY